jgi:ABC-type spermidine/putrescine transport system permease subunit I
VLWLCLFVVVPAYTLVAVAAGRIDELFRPEPAWNLFLGNPGFLRKAFAGVLPGGEYWAAARNTVVYVAATLVLCVAIGYPVAYYLARHARRSASLLLGLVVLPLWVSYLTRIMAWVGLLSPDGYVNRILAAVGVTHPPDWLGGYPLTVIAALVYGYVPFFILPVYAGLSRLDRGVLDAGRDLGASPLRAFLHVTLPLSRPSLLAGSALVVLPAFGDYYTNDLVSGSPRTSMLGNVVNLYVLGGPQKNLGASLVIVMMTILMVAMAYYAYATTRESVSAA